MDGRSLVTGGHGFVGTWLVDHLTANGEEVMATGEEVDVRDAAAVRRSLESVAPTTVYHLAGMAHVGSSWADPAETFAVNALGTVHVVDACRRLDPMPRVVIVSSAEVYGSVQPDELPLREDAPLRPQSPYAASKAAAEVVAVQAYRGWGLPAVVARPFNHIGPGQAPAFVVSALARRIVEAERSGSRELPMGNAAPRRDLTDVRDVVRAYALLAARGEPGEIYNVCSGEDVSIGELARRLVGTSGRDLEVVTDPGEVRPVDVPVLRGDPAKLTAVTGWKPEINLDQTLADVLAYWRDALPVGG